MSAAAFAWAGGGGEALRAKMEGVVRTLAECAGALGGYLSAFPPSHLDRYERIEPVRRGRWLDGIRKCGAGG